MTLSVTTITGALYRGEYITEITTVLKMTVSTSGEMAQALATGDMV